MVGPTQEPKNIVGMMKMMIENLPSWEAVDGLLLRSDYDFAVWCVGRRRNIKHLPIIFNNRIEILERLIVNDRCVDAYNCYDDISSLKKLCKYFQEMLWK